MPIPPRPVPSHSRTPRPGSSVPRKALASSHLDWRAEVALISELPAAPHARSVPGLGTSGLAAGMGGVRVVQPAGFERVSAGGAEAKGTGGSGADGGEARRREVGLEGLIAEGKGRREKRATTATTLGFDFIPNPSVLALPDTPAAASPKPSLLTASKGKIALVPASSPLSTSASTLSAAPVTTRAQPSSALSAPSSINLSANGRSSPSPLSKTPNTPALLPVDPRGQGSDEEEADDLSDWEHVPSHEDDVLADKPEEDECEDVIVLGELELEDCEEQGAGKRALTEGLAGKGAKGLSYAAALGKATAVGAV